MSYLQALNAGLLETADTVETLATVLSNGNTSSSSINLTSTGSLNLVSGDVTLTSGSIEFGTAGANGIISSDSVFGLNITSSLGIQCNTPVILNDKQLTFGYSTLSFPVSSGFGQVGSSFDYQNVSLFTLTNDLTWRTLFTDTNDIPAGIYMLSALITYTTTDAWTIASNIYFGLADVSTVTPKAGNRCGLTVNNGVCNMCVPFISSGDSENENVQFVYYTNMANITVNQVSWTLTRIG